MQSCQTARRSGNAAVYNMYFHNGGTYNNGSGIGVLTGNDITYDNELGCCYGSIFFHKNSEKDKIYTKINYEEIEYIFIRKYFYMETALEVFTNKNKSYIFNFKSNQDLTQFKNDLLQHWSFIEIKTEGKRIIGYEKVK